jgi:hypothetical protein
MMIEAIASDMPVVALRGSAVSEVSPAAWPPRPGIGPTTRRPRVTRYLLSTRRRVAANFIVGQSGSGYKRVHPEMARDGTGSRMMMQQVVKLVEPQHNRVGRVGQRAFV